MPDEMSDDPQTERQNYHSYSVNELANEAAVPRRTGHSYIAQGRLPSTGPTRPDRASPPRCRTRVSHTLAMGPDRTSAGRGPPCPAAPQPPPEPRRRPPCRHRPQTPRGGPVVNLNVRSDRHYIRTGYR